MTDCARAMDMLDLAAETDRQVWNGGGLATIATRNETVRAALTAGWTTAEIADRLGVREDDIVRWVTPARREA